MAKRLHPQQKQKTYGRNSDAKRRRRVDITSDIDPTLDDTALWRPSTRDNNGTMGFVPNTLSTSKLEPKRPTSQAAAMAASVPSEENIGTVMAFSGVQRDVATRALKVKHNVVEAAINAILEGEPLEKLEADMGWNESDMNDVQPLTGASAAPTRGNTPVGMGPSTQAEEDEQIAAAMAKSVGDLRQQETGTVNADGTISNMIGPANQYDQSQWAMVRYEEVLPEVDIAERVQKKDASEPRFLKHLTDGDYTPNLITICQAIPAVKEAFLMRSWLKNDYGFDEGWWRGQAIPTPTVVHVADGSPVDTLTDKHEEVIAEVQRLMAFLTSSDRVYGSTGGLTDTKLIREHNLTAGSLLDLFLKSWTAAASTKDATVSGLFTTKVGTSDKDGMDTPEMTVPEITVRSENGATRDLYGVLDDLFWDADLDEDNYIERPADVFVLTLKQSDSDKKVNVEVPPYIHLGKYLHENLASSRTLRKQMVEARQRIGKIEAVERKLTTWSYRDPHKAQREQKDKLEKEKGQIGPKQFTVEAGEVNSKAGNAQVAIKDLLAHSIAHFSGENRKDADATDYTPQADPPDFPEIAAELERILNSIEDKLKTLSINKEKTRSLLSDLSKPSPLDAGEEGRKYRYTLRGVATKPNTTYVLLPKTKEEIEMNGDDVCKPVDAEDTTPTGMQWWRLHYDSNSTSASINRSPIADYDVLRAAELEHNSALLVYASDRAAEAPAGPTPELPEPLQQFITRDNHQFRLDVAAAQRNPPRVDLTGVRDSIERDGDRRDSNSSMDVNMGYEPMDDSVAEIRLTPEPEKEEERGGDVEMAERDGARPITLTDTAVGRGSEARDTGAQHLENADVRMMG